MSTQVRGETFASAQVDGDSASRMRHNQAMMSGRIIPIQARHIAVTDKAAGALATLEVNMHGQGMYGVDSCHHEAVRDAQNVRRTPLHHFALPHGTWQDLDQIGADVRQIQDTLRSHSK